MRSRDGRHLRHRVDRVWPSAGQEQVRWFVSWDVQWVLCRQLRDGICRIFRGEWRHYRDRSRSGRGNRRFFGIGDFQRLTRAGEYHLQVQWRFPVVNRRTAGRSRFGFVVVYGVRTNRKGNMECESGLTGPLALACSSETPPKIYIFLRKNSTRLPKRHPLAVAAGTFSSEHYSRSDGVTFAIQES